MDKLLNIFMARMAANKFYQTDSDSDQDEIDDETVCFTDAESNCSLYGSTTSNEGDVQDEFDNLDDDLERNDSNSKLDESKHEHEGELNDANFEHLEAVNNHNHFEPESPAIEQNGYVNHEHDYAHDDQRDGIIVEVHPIHPPLQHAGVLSSFNNTLSNVVDEYSALSGSNSVAEIQVPPFKSCYFYRQSDHQPAESESFEKSSEFAGCSAVGQGIQKRSNSGQGQIEVKRMKDEECPQDIGAEITVKTEDLFVTEQNSVEHYPNINTMSDDILLEIFSKLSVNSLINIAPVCKHWYELSKHKSLWFTEDIALHPNNLNRFLRHVRAAKYLRTVDVSGMYAVHGEALSCLLNGPESVRRFSCFCVAHPRVIVELLERYQNTLEELNISISDERLSYGEGGTFKDGVKPRPGFLLKLISEMKNLRIIRFTGSMPSIGHHQGRVNPKWYFGELENPELKLQAIAMRLENPREILVQKFIIPFLRSKIPFLKELYLTSDILKNKEVQEIVSKCDKLEALVRFPIDCLHALENCKQQFFIDFVLGSWIDFQKIKGLLTNYKGLSHIHEVSLRFCDQLHIKSDEQILDTRLESFLPMLAESLHSCKRVHIYRWEAAPPFVESVHSTCALAKFLYALRRTLEEVHVSDAFKGGKHFPQLMKVIKESVPHLKSRGIAANRLGNKGLLFSVRKKSESVIPNTGTLLLEHGRYSKYPDK